jgi:hypothetical protein
MARMKPLPQTGEPITVTGPVKHMPAGVFPSVPPAIVLPRSESILQASR